MPAGLKVKNDQVNVEECFAIIRDIIHQSYKLEDNNKVTAPAGIFINQQKINGDRLITLNQNFTCQEAGLYIFESTYKLPSRKEMVSTWCLNISRPMEESPKQSRYLQTSCGSPIVTITKYIETYTIKYPINLQNYYIFPYFTDQSCYPSHKVAQIWESITYQDKDTLIFETKTYPPPSDITQTQFAHDVPFFISLFGRQGQLNFYMDFSSGNSFVGTQLVLVFKNILLDNTFIPYPYDKTTVTINVESLPRHITQLKVNLNQPKTQSFTLDNKAVNSAPLYPQKIGDPDPNVFVDIDYTSIGTVSLSIFPSYGNQINTYKSRILVQYIDDGAYDQIELTIIVEATYPHISKDPSMPNNFKYEYGQIYSLFNLVYSSPTANPSFQLSVNNTSSNTEITTFNPLSRDSNTNLMSLNCFQSNGIAIANHQYQYSIKLSEDAGSATYGPYIFLVTVTLPVFVDSFNESFSFEKQQKNYYQLPNVYPNNTSITLTQEDGTDVPSNIISLDPLSRKMTYFFDSATAETEVSTFSLIITLKSPVDERNFYQSVKFIGNSPPQFNSTEIPFITNFT